jgi:hypothetical protein
VVRTPAEVGDVKSVLKILNDTEQGVEILRHALKGRRTIGKYVHSKWKDYSNATCSFLAQEVQLTPHVEKRKNFPSAIHILSSGAPVSRPLYRIRKKEKLHFAINL